MIIDNNTTILNPTITLNWFFAMPNIIVSANFINNKNSYNRIIGHFEFNTNWVFISNPENSNDVNKHFENISIDDLSIQDLTYYQPPQPTGYGVVIPTEYLWAFPNNKFILHGTGFEIPLTVGSYGKAVDAAYLTWEAFLVEIWKPENKTVFDILEPVWLYCETEADNNRVIQL
jgi:hypothetical protein